MASESEPIEAEIVNKSTQSLIPATAHVAVTLARDPEKILEEATKAANALMRAIDAKPDKVTMNGKRYLVFEDWQTVGRFFNLVPKIREDKLIQIAMPDHIVTGYEATADVIDVVSGAVISSAMAMCLNDEAKWSARKKYVYGYVCKDGTISEQDPGYDQITWIPNPKSTEGKKMPKKEKMCVGEESVPLFQLRSMSQTRACAKALRNALAWVVVLAGFQPTPAEELDDIRGNDDDRREDDRIHTATPPARKPEPAKPSPQPAADSRPTPQSAPNSGTSAGLGKPITAGQQRRFWVIARTSKWSDEQVKAMLMKEFGIEHSEEIPQGKMNYDRLCDTVLPAGPEAYK